jgi:hypothetical protein
MLLSSAALRLISLGTLYGQGDAQSVLDATLDNHPAFDAQHPQRALTDKVDVHQAKETVPSLRVTEDVKLERKVDAAERAKLRNKRDAFVRARIEQLKKETRAEPTLSATAAPVEIERERPKKSSETKLTEKALREWDKTAEGKKLRSLDASEPTIPPLSR